MREKIIAILRKHTNDVSIMDDRQVIHDVDYNSVATDILALIENEKKDEEKTI